ncbi:hypothetical protein VE01_00777 [Pseudogymnoascus verrucosus]|uniref:Uncharacterized protein n=1 Tax=Pseudogymnoascus verrucosus TaxID=342668 RepID=A0A2P2SVX0_9PEZI|nr:uncharacterized protein VE01_00777 [Pseudogymnoascus verrucosus]OBU00950.1 hypothetical protein VE01_00777 [Pseudogymnoascus verrucosus]
MVLGIITSIAACPAIIGTTEAIRQGQRQNAREQHRGRKSNLLVSCSDPSRKARDINGGTIVLRNNKLYVTTVSPRGRAAKERREYENEKDPGRLNERGHLFAGYFFGYPDTKWGRRGDGLVSTISDDPPQLNWIYVDKDTYEVKYGLRVQAEGNLVGPWNCTPIDKRLTLEGWEGFTVVEEEEDVWALYFDKDDDGLEEKVEPNRRIMEIELIRKEMRIGKEEVDMAEQEEKLRNGNEVKNKRKGGENEEKNEKDKNSTRAA